MENHATHQKREKFEFQCHTDSSTRGCHQKTPATFGPASLHDMADASGQRHRSFLAPNRASGAAKSGRCRNHFSHLHFPSPQPEMRNGFNQPTLWSLSRGYFVRPRFRSPVRRCFPSRKDPRLRALTSDPCFFVPSLARDLLLLGTLGNLTLLLAQSVSSRSPRWVCRPTFLWPSSRWVDKYARFVPSCRGGLWRPHEEDPSLSAKRRSADLQIEILIRTAILSQRPSQFPTLVLLLQQRRVAAATLALGIKSRS